MTTIITHGGKIVADRRVKVDPCFGEIHFGDNFKKIIFSDCGRAAFVFAFVQPAKENIPVIIDAVLNTIINMIMNGDYLKITLKREVLLAIGKETSIHVAIKDRIYIINKLGEDKWDQIVRDEVGKNYSFIINRVNDEDFSAGGAGSSYAIGMHYADPTIPIEKLIPMVAKLDPATSKEFDMVDCYKLPPLIDIVEPKDNPVKRTRRKKP